MKLSRPSRFVAALVALFSVLFMQFAVASYVCPGQSTGQRDKPVTMAAGSGEQSMEGCMGMDMEQPGLCHAYDQAGKQSLDKPGTPPVLPFTPVALLVTLVVPEAVIPPTQKHTESLLLARLTAPPLSIQNCCFRI